MSIPYRREIDGLRAVAVLPVIFFHAGFEGFSGGFVGVDVFFVISGYLIGSLILSELRTGSFRFGAFYERRIRRLAPALIVVVLASIPAAWMLMTPKLLEDFAQSVVAVALLSSNVLFWIESGYFAPSAELKPLLHTWSLAVEEQFYLLFPLCLVLLYKAGPRVLGIGLALGFAASFATMLWLLQANPTGNFFLSPSRFWELLAGAICARYPVRCGPRLADGLAALGLLAILWAIVVFDALTPFPSTYALIPVLGTALVLSFAGQGLWVKRLMSVAPLVWVGLISYSAYLWHQPLFAFARLASPEEPTVAQYLALSALALGLAHLTWAYVERPFRAPAAPWTRGRGRIWGGYLTASALLLGIGLTGHLRNGFPERLSPDQAALLAWLDYGRTERPADPCFVLSPSAVPEPDTCLPEGMEIMVIGDSHAQALLAGFGGESRVGHLTSGACPPVRGYEDGSRPACAIANRLAFAAIPERRPPVLMLHAYWGHYRIAALLEELEHTLDWLREVSPDTRVVLVGNVPSWYPSLPETLIRRDSALVADLHLPLDVSAQARGDRLIAEFAQGRDVAFVSLLEALCDDGLCRASVAAEGAVHPLVWDNAHLTAAGARFVHDRILRPALAAVAAE